jgi:uncharacterized protein (DUF2267 family)
MAVIMRSRQMSHDVFGEAIAHANTWVGSVAGELDTDKERAHRALRATLHTLRDRLTVEGAAHLAAQLPLVVRGVFFEGWKPSAVPQKMHHDEFLERVREEAMLETSDEAQDAVRAVMSVMWEHVTPGALDHVAAQLPTDLQWLVY